MTLRGGLALGGRVLGATGRILVDRVAEAHGRALPRTPEQLARPEVLDALLREGAPSGATPPPRVLRVRLPAVDFESSNCRNFLVEVAFDGAAPETLYAKIPCAAFATRAFANAVGFWSSEVTFCRNLAAHVPIRVPRVHAALRRGARFVLLLENVAALPGARLFLNRDMAAGTTPERARRCLEAFAALHGAFWDFADAERERLLPARLHPYLAAGGRERNRALNAAAIAPAHRAAPGILTARHAAICREALAKWDALLDAWYRPPLTLVHGDSHLANCFEYDAADGRRVGMLDFQGVQWCPGVRDVQYHLINSLDPALLAECEEEMLRAYVHALATHGVALGLDDARAQYRAFAFQTLMVSVVALGLGSLTEREATVRTLLARSVAALDRLDFADWLAGL